VSLFNTEDFSNDLQKNYILKSFLLIKISIGFNILFLFKTNFQNFFLNSMLYKTVREV